MCKNYVIFWGGGGEVLKRLHWITRGRGGGLGGPKKDYVIFEWPLKGKYRLIIMASKYELDSGISSCSILQYWIVYTNLVFVKHNLPLPPGEIALVTRQNLLNILISVFIFILCTVALNPE